MHRFILLIGGAALVFAFWTWRIQDPEIAVQPAYARGVASVPGDTHTALYPIKHIIIIDKENRSFDTMFGLFPGADGASRAELSTGRIVPLGHMPDQPSLDVGHAGAAAVLAVNNGKMNAFDLLPGAIQNGKDTASSH